MSENTQTKEAETNGKGLNLVGKRFVGRSKTGCVLAQASTTEIKADTYVLVAEGDGSSGQQLYHMGVLLSEGWTFYDASE